MDRVVKKGRGRPRGRGAAVSNRPFRRRTRGAVEESQTASTSTCYVQQATRQVSSPAVPPQAKSKRNLFPQEMVESVELFDHPMDHLLDKHSKTSNIGQEIKCSEEQPITLSAVEEDSMLVSTVSPPHSQELLVDEELSRIPDAVDFITVMANDDEYLEEESGDDVVLDPNWHTPNEDNMSSSSEEQLEVTRPRKSSKSQRSLTPVILEAPAASDPVSRRTLRQVTSKRKAGSNPIWCFFKPDPKISTNAICNECKKSISRGKDKSHLSNTTMPRHLKSTHRAIWLRYQEMSNTTLPKKSHHSDAPSTCGSHTSDCRPGMTVSSATTTQRPTSWLQELHDRAATQPSLSSMPWESSPSTQFAVNANIQTSIPEMIARKRKYPPTHERAKATTSLISQMLAQEMLPFRLVDSKSFRNLLSYLAPQYVVPSRFYFSRRAVPALHQHVVQEITCALHQSVSAQVHLTTDTWTSKHGLGRYMSITAHWVNVVDARPCVGGESPSILPSPRRVGRLSRPVSSSTFSGSSNSESSLLDSGEVAFSEPLSALAHDSVQSYRGSKALRQQAVLKLYFMEDKSHTAAELKMSILEQTRPWFAPVNLEIGKVVSDNGANLVAAIKLLKVSHVPCLAHVFNLVVQRFLKTYPCVAVMLGKARKFCAHVKRSSGAKARLSMLQKRHHLPSHSLICDVSTRWNSTLHMLDRLYEQKPAIVDLQLQVHSFGSQPSDNVQLTAVEWATMQDICSVLRCLEYCSQVVSEEDAIVSTTIPLLYTLRQTLNDLRDIGSRSLEEQEEESIDHLTQCSVRFPRFHDVGLGQLEDSRSQTQATTGRSSVREECEEDDDDEEEEVSQQPHSISSTWFPTDDTPSIVHGWADTDETVLTTNTEVRTSLPPGTLGDMCEFMIQCLDQDTRITNIIDDPEYWVATLLDPRFRDKMASLTPIGVLARGTAFYKSHLLNALIKAFPDERQDSRLGQNLSQHADSGGQHHTGSRAASRSGSRVMMQQAWRSFLKPSDTVAAQYASVRGWKQKMSLQVEDYTRSHIDILPHESFPFDFWVSKIDLWPELAQYALRVLACPAASVLSERVFSTASEVLTDRRMRLSPGNVDRLTFIKMNEKWISKGYTAPVAETNM